VLAVLLAAPLFWSPCQAQSHLLDRHTVQAPERTDAGDWVGTWYYVSRIRKMVLWVRENNGEIKIKVRIAGSAGKSESVTTDWDSQGEYVQSGKPGSFRLEFDQRDADTITGRWIWDYGSPEVGKSERAEFTMYRGGHGRQLVWKFKDFEHKNWGGERNSQRLDDVVWTLQKVSRREALWGEMPF
jgi:hypothetical protein